MTHSTWCWVLMDACNDTFSIVLCVVETCNDTFSIVLCVNGHMQ